MPFRSPVSRRQVLAAGGTGLLAATAGSTRAAARTRKARGDGTPEQIHLTWGENPATDVVVSWASPGPATRPRVRIGQRIIPAESRQYTDGINGETVWTYHARVGGLRPGATYVYVVTADNDGNTADPFTATVRTAPRGRVAFRFTSFGDLATPNTAWVLSYGQSAYAVDAVRVLPAAVSPAERRPVLRGPQPHRAARGVARLRQQQPDLGRQPALDAVPGQPRGGVRQRGAGILLIPDPLHAAGQPCARLRRALVQLPHRVGPVRLPRRRRRGVPGRGRVRGRPRGADPGGGRGPPGDRARYVVLHQGLFGRRADRLAEADAGGGPQRPVGRLDHRADAPVHVFLVGDRERLRSRHPPAVAAAVRPVPGGPGAERARPRLRAVFPGTRRRRRRRPRGSHWRRGQYPAAASGDDHRQRGIRHQPGHRASHPGLRRHRRPAGRVRDGHR